MKKNQVTTGDMSLIMEGLQTIIQNNKKERDHTKVQKAQQLYDRLNDYTTEFVNSQNQ
tara:strand:- start:261 stop:434 length:174 start_codon:yes stop_codon:yes gene_type:complete